MLEIVHNYQKIVNNFSPKDFFLWDFLVNFIL